MGRDVRVVVRDRANETRHAKTYEVAPNEVPWTVYEHGAAAGAESLRIVVTTRGATERLTVDTGDCWGTINAQVTQKGTLRLFADHC